VNVPTKYRTADGIRLWVWITVQRSALRRGKLSPEREASLVALGVELNDAQAIRWDNSFAVVATLVKANGHANFPLKYRTPEGVCPSTWLQEQRSRFKRGLLSAERTARMRAAGIPLILGDGQRLPSSDSGPRSSQWASWCDASSSRQRSRNREASCAGCQHSLPRRKTDSGERVCSCDVFYAQVCAQQIHDACRRRTASMHAGVDDQGRVRAGGRGRERCVRRAATRGLEGRGPLTCCNRANGASMMIR